MTLLMSISFILYFIFYLFYFIGLLLFQIKCQPYNVIKLQMDLYETIRYYNRYILKNIHLKNRHIILN